MLHHDSTRCRLVAVADISNLEADEIATAQLAVYPEVEEGELAYSVFHLQADSKHVIVKSEP